MRRRSPETLLILGLVFAAFCAGCGGSGAPSGLPVEDDFSDCSTGWSTDEDEFGSLSCAEGEYRVLAKKPKPRAVRIFFDTGVEMLSVEADATYAAGPRTSAFGVGCWASPDQGYIFSISPGAAWAIIKWNNKVARPLTLLAESDENAIPGFSDANRIRGVCVGGGREPTVLALYVNGERIATTEDRVGHDSFPGFGFSVFSTEGGLDVRFDNLAARELIEAEARRTRAAHSAQKLCKESGIRYVGRTAQGAVVCFTLSRDGSALVETGFNFVRASGCPDRAVGNVYSDFPASLDASGRFENPDGLTATVRGATASGVFADPSICPGKQFRWSARRQP